MPQPIATAPRPPADKPPPRPERGDGRRGPEDTEPARMPPREEFDPNVNSTRT